MPACCWLPVEEAANSPDIFTGAADPRFWIGLNHWDSPYTGRIDALEFFDEALTAGEVAGLYDEQSAQ